MTLKQQKEELLKWYDYWGGQILDTDGINKATSKKQLAEILNHHEGFLEDQLSDALSGVQRLRQRIELEKHYIYVSSYKK